jgi:hypothetical protein
VAAGKAEEMITAVSGVADVFKSVTHVSL